MKKPVKLKRPRTPEQEDAVDLKIARKRLSHWNEVERRRSTKLGEIEVRFQAALKEKQSRIARLTDERDTYRKAWQRVKRDARMAARQEAQHVHDLEQERTDLVLLMLASNESGTATDGRDRAKVWNGSTLRSLKVPSRFSLERGEEALTFSVRWENGVPRISPAIRKKLQEWFR